MLTGVTKFGKVSVFSDLNNLEDLSMWNEYVTLCGVSNQEIHENLEEELHTMKSTRNWKNGMTGITSRIILSACTIRLVC